MADTIKQEKILLEAIVCAAVNEFNTKTGIKVKKIKPDYLESDPKILTAASCTITLE